MFFFIHVRLLLGCPGVKVHDSNDNNNIKNNKHATPLVVRTIIMM